MEECLVAPREGSVDRNIRIRRIWLLVAMSLPARGAWIEISPGTACNGIAARRSPRGERG